jgi:hypothetical protein
VTSGEGRLFTEQHPERIAEPPGRAMAVVLLIVLLAAAIWWGGLAPSMQPPPVVAENAPESEFSAERARHHLREITRQPRPVGSEAHALTRDYLLNQLRELGLEPEVQHATGVRRFGSTVRSADAVNVMARIDGAGDGRAVVLMAHYDSVPHSPGANDAGNGVSAILETARALLAGPPLENDVILLITDAEEVGLLGAQAFVEEHSWAGEIGIVLNVEGRGQGGPVHMFRTAGGNGNMIRLLGRSVPRPSAESLSSAVFGLMPNDTDLTVFEQAGHAGMDFANVHGLTHYHMPMDSYERADPRSLQQHGEYLLNLARGFGNEDLASLAAPERVYFTAPVFGLIHYPAAWALPLAMLMALAVVAIAWRASKHADASPGRVVLGALALIGMIGLLPVLGAYGWGLIRMQVPEYPWFGNGAVYHSIGYLAAFCLLATAGFVMLVAGLRRWLRVGDLFLGTALVWAVLGLAASWWLPGASYLLLWPLLFALAGFAFSRWRFSPAVGAGVVALCSLPIIFFYAQMVVEIEVAMTLDMIGAPLALLVMALGLMVVTLEHIRSELRWTLPTGLALAGVAILVGLLWQAGFDENRKKPNSVEYIADVSAGEAAWYSMDPEPDEWTRQYLGPEPAQDGLPEWAPAYLREPDWAWHRPAELVEMDAPDARLIGVESSGGESEYRVHVTAPTGAYATVIEFAQLSGMRSLSINGREVPGTGEAESEPVETIIHYGMDEAGVELRFTAEDADDLELVLRSNIPGLPTPESGSVPPRTDSMMAAGPSADRTRMQRTVRLDTSRGEAL